MFPLLRGERAQDPATLESQVGLSGNPGVEVQFQLRASGLVNQKFTSTAETNPKARRNHFVHLRIFITFFAFCGIKYLSTSNLLHKIIHSGYAPPRWKSATLLWKDSTYECSLPQCKTHIGSFSFSWVSGTHFPQNLSYVHIPPHTLMLVEVLVIEWVSLHSLLSHVWGFPSMCVCGY